MYVNTEQLHILRDGQLCSCFFLHAFLYPAIVCLFMFYTQVVFCILACAKKKKKFRMAT